MIKYGRTQMLMSKEQIEFLKKIKRKKRIILIIQISITVLFLSLWQYAADKNWIKTYIYSSPKRIIETNIKINPYFTTFG